MKKLLREKILAERIRHNKAEEDSKKIWHKFVNLPLLKNAKNILFYYPHKNEVDTKPIINELIKKGNYRIFLPKVSKDDIVPVEIKNLFSLKKGYAGILEPEGEGVSPDFIDIVVVPAVVFDLQGHRIGYGKGYYDRFLKKTDAVKVGVAYDFQIIKKIPYDDHDVPVDIIVTPTRIINTKEEKAK